MQSPTDRDALSKLDDRITYWVRCLANEGDVLKQDDLIAKIGPMLQTRDLLTSWAER